jgi:tRNA uridine 5-carbamoylmethylation protein Kti12
LFKDAVVISSDDIIEREAAKVGMTYNQAFQTFIETASKESYQSFLDAVKDGTKDIIVDRTNMSEKSRKKYLDRAKGFERVAVIFKASRPVLFERNMKRRGTGKYISADIINDMLVNYESPADTEKFDKIFMVASDE